MMRSVIRFLLLILISFSLSGCAKVAKVFSPVYNFHPQEKQSFNGKRKPMENNQLQEDYRLQPEVEKAEITYTWLNKAAAKKQGMSENVISHHYYNANKDLTRGVKPLLNQDYSSLRRDIIYEYSSKEARSTNFFELAEPLSQPGPDGLDYSETIASHPYDMKDPRTQEFVDDYYTPSYQKGTEVDPHSGYDAYQEFLQPDEHTHSAKDHEFFYDKKMWRNLGRNN